MLKNTKPTPASTHPLEWNPDFIPGKNAKIMKEEMGEVENREGKFNWGREGSNTRGGEKRNK